MHTQHPHPRRHTHAFGQERKRPGETRTIIVIAITGTMMVVEISSGIIFGSMALLADGLHMASHAVALGINAFAYIYARRHAHDRRYSFGTGKMNALGGFTGAVLLAVFALMMAAESLDRFIHPTDIAFNQAILVAVLGLIVNGASVWILDAHQNHERDQRDAHRHDHNLKAAYLHVLADALTSLLAIFALLTAKYFGLIWMDPLMGILGALLVSRWSLGLLRDSGATLLDKEGPPEIRKRIEESIENEKGTRIGDLHLWSIGPNIYGVLLSIVTHDPKPPEHYAELIPSDIGVVHTTVEVHRSSDSGDSLRASSKPAEKSKG